MSTHASTIEQNGLIEDIENAVEFLRQHAGYVEKASWEVLKRIGSQFELEEVEAARPVVVYDANFSMAEEIQSQIMAVRAVRNKIMNADGSLSRDITTREAKEVVSSGSTLLTTLMKFHEKVQNMERLRLLETAVVEVLEGVDEDVRDQVLHRMEEKLANLA
jgi:hypothetical protein